MKSCLRTAICNTVVTLLIRSVVYLCMCVCFFCRMAPDEAGRYGFNVKGGSDQDQPVTVSRINDDTPVGGVVNIS